MKKRIKIYNLAKASLLIALGALSGSHALATTQTYNFDADPYSQINVFYTGDNGTLANMAGYWFATNGSPNEAGVGDQSTNGYWAITQTTPTNSFTAHGMRSELVIPVMDSNAALSGFTFSCDVRIGGGHVTPADGISISFARIGDGTTNNAAEKGTATGLAVDLLAYDGDSATGIRGLQINYDSVAVTNVALPTRNGLCGDTTSVQTGPVDMTLSHDDAVNALCWQPLWINFNAGYLSVSYKGVSLITNVYVVGGLGAGNFVIAGRTGGLWEEQDIDNISITTVPSVKPVVGPMLSTLSAFAFKIYDSGSASPATNSITMTIDGSAVTPTLIKATNGITTVSYRSLAQLFQPNTLHTNVIHFTGSFSGSVDQAIPFFVSAPSGAVSKVGGYSGAFRANAQYSPNGGGHTGLPGDYAMDFVQGGANNAIVVTDPLFLSFIQDAGAADVMSMSFWERRRSLPGGVPSVMWVVSPSDSQGRGWQMHCPYADERIFFDTSGFGAGQRAFSPVNSTTMPGFVDDGFWTNSWRHIVAIKNGTSKQVWVDGFLFINVNDQTTPLHSDFSTMYIGGAIGNNSSINGLIDDFAVYNSALSAQDVTNLFTGTAPNSISAAPNLIAWWDFNDTAPYITVTNTGSASVLIYSQTLQSSTNLTGPYVDVPGASSPYTNDVTANPVIFFRTRK